MGVGLGLDGSATVFAVILRSKLHEAVYVGKHDKASREAKRRHNYHASRSVKQHHQGNRKACHPVAWVSTGWPGKKTNYAQKAERYKRRGGCQRTKYIRRTRRVAR